MGRAATLALQGDLWGTLDPCLDSETGLFATAFSICEGFSNTLTRQDIDLWKKFGKPAVPKGAVVAKIAAKIANGGDPLGEAFCSVKSAEVRRDLGATYTPPDIVSAMVEWAVAYKTPARVVDPGCGSARFLRAAAQVFPHAELFGIECDPLAALIARANLAVAGLGARSRVVLSDFRSCKEDPSTTTLYIGNPPYVRHHKIDSRWKQWLTEQASKLKLSSSQLAGLHVHFYLATAIKAKPGDFGVFITASEWLDVNYGSLVRQLLLGPLGGRSVTVLEPTARPFPDASTTAAIATFEVGTAPQSLSFKRVNTVEELKGLEDGRKIHRERLLGSSRWSYLTHNVQRPPEGFVELGELCRVHRGQVTGANSVWIAGEHSVGLPKSVLFPTVTRAKEIISAEGNLDDAALLRNVIDIPWDLDNLKPKERSIIESFLKKAKTMGANDGYVANHRKAWWAVGLRAPAPIISTYMARRAPAFVVNRAKARHINIAHGLYPRATLSTVAMERLTVFLRGNVCRQAGRTYAGGLTKFEPREMERILVPTPTMLEGLSS